MTDIEVVFTQVLAMKTPAEVSKEAMQSMEASVGQFIEMLGEVEEETAVQVISQPLSLPWPLQLGHQTSNCSATSVLAT